MAVFEPEDFHYRFPDKVFGHVPGAHTGTSLGSGDRFAGFADLFDYPDPRRLDIRASMRTQLSGMLPGEEQRWLVRRYQQRASVTLWLLADLSASMSVGSVNNEYLARLAHMVAHSAIRTGDRFGMAGFDSQWRQDVSVMPTRQRSMPQLAADKILQARPPQHPGADGLPHAAEIISSPHALVFLASDFCCDLSMVDSTLRRLSRYTVIPVVWQHDDVDHFPSHAGWTEMRDSETGVRHSVWMRPKMKQRWQQTMQDHFEQLDACFTRHRVRPLYVSGAVSPDTLTEYFFSMKKS